MIHSIIKDRPTKLFIILAGFFIANALIAEVIGVKIFSLERSFGFKPVSFSLFGEDNLAFSLTAGVLLWPVVFLMTDIINEYYGVKGVRFLSFLAIVLISFAFLAFFGAIKLPPPEWWLTSSKIKAVDNMQSAYSAVLGQSNWIIFASLVAFGVGQLVDVYIFHRIKKATGEGKIWLRATLSTLISQLIDSYIVLFIAFYIGGTWTWQMVLAVGMMNYIYKFVVAILLTPVIYFIHARIEKYLGHDTAAAMKKQAMSSR